MRNVLLVLFLTFVSGCVQKKLVFPDITNELPPDGNFSLPRDSNFSEIPSFQSFLQIPELDSLVKQGLKQNPEWKLQLAKLEVVSTKFGLDKAESLPSLSSEIKWQHGRENTRESNFNEKSLPNWQGGAMFNWEIDLWGKWKSVKESASLHIREAEYLKEAAQISFSHAIAQLWISLTAQKEQLEILGKLIETQEKKLQVYQPMVDVGREENSTIIRENLALNESLQQQAKLLRKFEVNKIRIQSLIGTPIQDTLPNIPSITQIKIPQLPEVFPTLALRKRPDLLAKEAKIKESLYLEKSKRYDLYPSLSFQTSGISLSNDLSQPFEQWKASLGPVLRLPIWSPQKKATLNHIIAQSEAYKQEWLASINLAIEEIEVSTKSFIMGQNEFSLATETHQNSIKLFNLSLAKFNAGILSSPDLWTDEQVALKTESKLIATRLQLFEFALALSKALSLRMTDPN
jgi:multidrug efflux system outer membrane protein